MDLTFPVHCNKINYNLINRCADTFTTTNTMAPPFNIAQRTVLHSMIGLLQALVTEQETDTFRLDRCLLLISELPAIRSLMGEEDDNADGMDNEVCFVDRSLYC